jgi:hypothetical protein
VVSDELGELDETTWMDRNQERVIPAGFTSETVASEWVVEGKRITAAAVGSKALEQALSGLRQGRYVPRSVAVPLWDLGKLYGPYYTDPCVLWKCLAAGSVLAYVAEGSVRRVLTFWVGVEDLKENPAEAARALGPVVRSLAEGTDAPVVPVGPELAELLREYPLDGLRVVAAPEVPGVPVAYHEAWALACHAASPLDFCPSQVSAKAEESARHRPRVLTAAWAAVIVVVAGALVLAGVDLTVRAGERIEQVRLEPVRVELDSLSALHARADSLQKQVSEHGALLGRESAVTPLLAGLQSVFPEGAWADNIVVAEESPSAWSIDLVAMAQSTAAIPEVLQRLSALEMVTDARMLYSEQTTGGKGVAKGVRFKISAKLRVQ